jgi:hypothetical protein
MAETVDFRYEEVRLPPLQPVGSLTCRQESLTQNSELTAKVFVPAEGTLSCFDLSRAFRGLVSFVFHVRCAGPR